MTEREWLASDHPHSMSSFLCDQRALNRTPIGRRKLRLYACACCRRAWPMLDEGKSREAVEIAERYADGLVPRSELVRMLDKGQSGFLCQSVCDQIGRAVVQIPHQASFLLGLDADAMMQDRYRATVRAEEVVQVALLRDIFGNPFRPVTLDPNWLTSDVLALAKGIYDEKAFDRMPILHDALMDAGCTNQDVLEHCRSDGPHVRGCWVIDLLLGKS